jgi:L-ascorbate metabolism protein UlaG (beta-lactamase superfamily)
VGVLNKHKRRGRFRNEIAFSNLTGWHDRKSKQAIPVGMLPVEKPEIAEHADEGELKVTWLGHSTSFLQVGDQNILIDPVLSSRVSPLGFVGPKRFSDCAFEKEDVPDIQVVFISHDHYDHLDQATIMAMDARVGCYIVPLGVDTILKGWGIEESKLHPLDWWEDIEQKGITFTLTPALHYTGRSPLKLNSTLWGGLYIMA